MRNKHREDLNPDGGVVEKSRPCGPKELTSEALDNVSRAGANGEIKDIVAVLADIERLVSPLADIACTQATRLTDAHKELARSVGSVRDLAKATADVTREIRAGSLAVERDPRTAARGVVLLARILTELNELSKTAAVTIRSQAAATRNLVDILGEAAKAGIHLVGKVSTLAEEVLTILPPLSNKRFVQAQLECLAGELQKVLAEFRCGSGIVSEAVVNVATRQLPAKSQLVN